MSESFIQAQNIKRDIERQIGELDLSKAFVLHHTDKDFNILYEQSKQRLENEARQIQYQIDQLQNMLNINSYQMAISFIAHQIIRQIKKIFFINNFNRKASNIEGQIKELTSYLRRISGKKMDALKQEKDKNLLYGASRVNYNDNHVINLQMQNREQINSNMRLSNEMTEHGRNILSAFKNQSQTLKGVQKKVLNIVNELGISSQMVKLIGSRNKTDNIIICSLFIFLLFFIGICYYVIRPIVKGY